MSIEKLEIKSVNADGGNYMGYKGLINIGDIIFTDKDDVNEVLKKTFPKAQLKDLHPLHERSINVNDLEGINIYNDSVFVRIETDTETDYGFGSYYDVPIIDIFTEMKSYHSPKTVDIDTDDFRGWDEIKQYIIDEYEPIAILPISAYIHSGVSIFEGSAIGWDSGNIGFGWISQKQAEIENLSKEQAEEKIKKYIKYMNDVYQGNIYEVFIYDLTNEPNKNEFIIESCGDFVGSDIKNNGIMDFVKSSLNENQLKGLFDNIDK